jgi:DNA-binding NarL/FixJ family response regulator
MNLLLADDHDLVRDSLKVFIERDASGMTVTAVGSLDAAIEAASSAAVDVAVLDLRMPGMDGLEGLGRFRTAHPRVPVVIMSGQARPQDVREAVAAGASGFVPKSSSALALVNAVRLVLSGERFFPPEQLMDAPDDQSSGASAAFTRRERDVLACLVQGQSNKEIARALDLQEVTVKLHLRSVFRKLGVKSRTQAVLAAVERGLASQR